MKVCECGYLMTLTKYEYEYVWECEECKITEMVNEDEELEEGEF